MRINRGKRNKHKSQISTTKKMQIFFSSCVLCIFVLWTNYKFSLFSGSDALWPELEYTRKMHIAQRAENACGGKLDLQSSQNYLEGLFIFLFFFVGKCMKGQRMYGSELSLESFPLTRERRVFAMAALWSTPYHRPLIAFNFFLVALGSIRERFAAAGMYMYVSCFVGFEVKLIKSPEI